MATDPSTPQGPTAFAATAFFAKTYDEDRDLLIDARDYLRVMDRSGGAGWRSAWSTAWKPRA